MTDLSQTRTELIAATPQIRGDAWRVLQLNGAGSGNELRLREGENSFGAAGDADLHIDSPGVSRRHFVIINADGELRLRDLDSKNGTYVEDLRVGEVYLTAGATIRAGEIRLRCEPVFERLAPAAELDAFGGLVGHSPAMREIFGALAKVAPSRATVILTGETGTGKGAMARAVHSAGPLQEGPFEVFDCGAISPTLVESELFGHERGAFTGAVQQRTGALENANGGTLLIDELSDLAPELQPKLLRALEEGEYKRVGGSKALKVNCRIIAATQHDLWDEVQAGRFRRDLYFRLAVVTVPLPPLRERREAIPHLVDHFLRDADSKRFERFATLSPKTQKAFLAHAWPGNVRELRNAVERLVVMGSADLDAQPTADDSDGSDGNGLSHAELHLPFKSAKQTVLERFEREYLAALIERCERNVAKAAREAQVDRKHLYSLLTKYGLLG